MVHAESKAVTARHHLQFAKCDLQELAYPLLATMFDWQQCKKIISPIVQVGLPAASFVCTLAHMVAHGPLQFAGVDIPDLFTKQMVMQVVDVLHHEPVPSTTMLLIQVTGEAMQLKSGFARELFETPFCQLHNQLLAQTHVDDGTITQHPYPI